MRRRRGAEQEVGDRVGEPHAVSIEEDAAIVPRVWWGARHAMGSQAAQISFATVRFPSIFDKEWIEGEPAMRSTLFHCRGDLLSSIPRAP